MTNFVCSAKLTAESTTGLFFLLKLTVKTQRKAVFPSKIQMKTKVNFIIEEKIPERSVWHRCDSCIITVIHFSDTLASGSYTTFWYLTVSVPDIMWSVTKQTHDNMESVSWSPHALGLYVIFHELTVNCLRRLTRLSKKTRDVRMTFLFKCWSCLQIICQDPTLHDHKLPLFFCVVYSLWHRLLAVGVFRFHFFVFGVIFNYLVKEMHFPDNDKM